MWGLVMKKKLFILLTLIMVLLMSVSVVLAGELRKLYIGDGYVSFGYFIEYREDDDEDFYLHYFIEFTFTDFYDGTRPSVNLREDDLDVTCAWFDCATAEILDEKDEDGNTIYYVEGVVNVPYSLGVSHPDYAFLNIPIANEDSLFGYDLFELDGEIYNPDPTPAPTSTPTPTNTPEPTATPKPDPTATPEPTPTNTPVPTPTNTPTPTPSPTPAPLLYLNAYIDEYDNAVAEYSTGGCTPVKSIIALYEVPDRETLGGSVVEQEVFVSGSGVMEEPAVMGKLYRYKLTYTFIQDGVQRTKFLWSDVLEVTDDYVATGDIRNFRDLMYFIWYDLFSLDMLLEDKFSFSIKSFYLWILIAGVLLVLIFKKVLD